LPTAKTELAQAVWRRVGELSRTGSVNSDDELITRLATAIVAAGSLKTS
jgi:hypothetical protein